MIFPHPLAGRGRGMSNQFCCHKRAGARGPSDGLLLPDPLMTRPDRDEDEQPSDHHNRSVMEPAECREVSSSSPSACAAEVNTSVPRWRRLASTPEAKRCVQDVRAGAAPAPAIAPPGPSIAAPAPVVAIATTISIATSRAIDLRSLMSAVCRLTARGSSNPATPQRTGSDVRRTSPARPPVVSSAGPDPAYL